MRGKIGTSTHGKTRLFKLDKSAIIKAGQLLRVSSLLSPQEIEVCMTVARRRQFMSTRKQNMMVWAKWIQLAKLGKLHSGYWTHTTTGNPIKN